MPKSNNTTNTTPHMKLLRHLFGIFCILLLAGYISAQCLNNNQLAGSQVGKWCSCYSGFASSSEELNDCLLKVDSQCDIKPPADLSSNYPAYIDQEQSNTLNDMLTLVIRAPVVTNRLDSGISFIGGDESCAYPGEMWSKKLNSCDDVFTLRMPLSKAVDCGFVRRDETRSFLLSAGFKVSQKDKIGDLRGTPLTRTTESVLRMEIRFPKKTVVASEINRKARSINGKTMGAIIITQMYDPATNAGFLEYLTTLPYPLRVSEVTKLNIPKDIEASVVVADHECTEEYGSECTQRIMIKLDASNVCSLSGQYNLTMAFECRGQIQVCKTDVESDVIASTIISEDFCYSISHDVRLKGDLVIFQDYEHTTLKTGFMSGQRAYFLASVSAERVTILATKVRSVFITSSKDRHATPIYNELFTSSIAEANAFSISPHTPSSIGFEIDVSIGNAETDLFPADADLDAYEFTAVLEVAYEGPSGVLYKDIALTSSLYANHVPRYKTCDKATHTRAIASPQEENERASSAVQLTASALAVVALAFL